MYAPSKWQAILQQQSGNNCCGKVCNAKMEKKSAHCKKNGTAQNGGEMGEKCRRVYTHKHTFHTTAPPSSPFFYQSQRYLRNFFAWLTPHALFSHQLKNGIAAHFWICVPLYFLAFSREIINICPQTICRSCICLSCTQISMPLK